MNHKINGNTIKKFTLKHTLHSILKYKNNWMLHADRVGRKELPKVLRKFPTTRNKEWTFGHLMPKGIDK
jgi:hypothetical protein